MAVGDGGTVEEGMCVQKNITDHRHRYHTGHTTVDKNDDPGFFPPPTVAPGGGTKCEPVKQQ